MDKIKIVIADNHPAFREGLCRLLEDEKELDEVDPIVWTGITLD